MSLTSLPGRLLYYVYSAFLSVLLPLTPKLVPVVVCALFVPLVFFLSFTASFVVWSAFSISWVVPLYLQYGDGQSPYATVDLPKLVANQRYNIFLDLVVPYTDSNVKLGNFMSSLTLTSFNNETIAFTRRPAVVVAPTPGFFSRVPTTIPLRIPLLEPFIPSTPNLIATVQVGRSDAWKTIGPGEGRELSVLSASLKGVAIPHGIRGLGIRFPLLSSFAVGLIFLLILSTIVGFCILPHMLPSSSSEEDEDVPIKMQHDAAPLQPSRRHKSLSLEKRGRSRRAKSKSTDDDQKPLFKREPSPQIIPPADDAAPPVMLRKRSSRTKLEEEEES